MQYFFAQTVKRRRVYFAEDKGGIGRMQRIMAPKFQWKKFVCEEEPRPEDAVPDFKAGVAQARIHPLCLYAHNEPLPHADLIGRRLEFGPHVRIQGRLCPNRRYGLSNHFWGDRYRSTIIQDERHALAGWPAYAISTALLSKLVWFKHPEQGQFNSFCNIWLALFLSRIFLK